MTKSNFNEETLEYCFGEVGKYLIFFLTPPPLHLRFSFGFLSASEIVYMTLPLIVFQKNNIISI